MAFVVTARKWRPQRFDEVVGQEHITATLKNAIKNNRIAHAYLFTGPRGVGKTTTARILAKSLNCLNPVDNEPCNECEMCRSIQSTQSLDIIEIDGASNRGIDEIRTLRESVKYAPTKGKYKIYIIDEVHMLTKESFNAFLKTLEEPPAHTIFIFATTDVHKVPLTIISRCQRFDFRRIQLDTIKSLLTKIADSEKIEIDDKTLTIIAKKADGALRDAESFFDQVVSFCGNKIDFNTVSKMLNLVDDDIYFDLSDAVIDKNYKMVFEVTDTIYKNGWNFIDFMDGLTEHFRNIMTVVLTGRADLVEAADIYKEKYVQYSGKFSEGDILRLLNFLTKTQQELRFAQNQKLKLEIALSHLIGLERSATISDLLSKIENSDFSNNEPGNKPNTKSYNKNPVEQRKINESPKTNYTSPSKRSLNNNIESTARNTKVTNPQTAAQDISFSFNSIIQKWEGFVDAVSSEKGLILGPIMKNAKPLGLDGNKLKLECDIEYGEKELVLQEEYLGKKTHEFFGKKLAFHIQNENQFEKRTEISSPDIEIQQKKSEKKVVAPADNNDPYVKVILNELGGEEIL